MKEQSYSNHTRFFPFLHFFVTPVTLILLFVQAYRSLDSMATTELIILLIVFLLVCSNIAARLQALKAQDRVIRLEEFLRYEKLLDDAQCSKARQLPSSQVIALRFASDKELPELVDRVFSGELVSGKQIKQAIKEWKADHHRV